MLPLPLQPRVAVHRVSRAAADLRRQEGRVARNGRLRDEIEGARGIGGCLERRKGGGARNSCRVGEERGAEEREGGEESDEDSRRWLAIPSPSVFPDVSRCRALWFPRMRDILLLLAEYSREASRGKRLLPGGGRRAKGSREDGARRRAGGEAEKGLADHRCRLVRRARNPDGLLFLLGRDG